MTPLPESAALAFVIPTGGVMGFALTKGGENGFHLATTLPGSAVLPFVISTEAQRSGEISVWMLLLGNVSTARLEWTPCA
jgi:hypothetical protein